MFISLNQLAYIASVPHEGKVIVVGVDKAGKLFYTVRQDGFEESYTNTPPEQRTGWENWQVLQFPNEPDDVSVTERQAIELTYQNDANRYFMRSLYKTDGLTEAAPLCLVSTFGHLYLFRQSKQKTLLVDRYVFDGLTNKLNRKIEVRFKRSRKKFQPSKSMNKSERGLTGVDSLDFNDSDGRYFYEPTTELSLINKLINGWFSVVCVPTLESDVFRWHIFFYNSSVNNLELITLRASEDGLFEFTDYTVLEVINDVSCAHKIPGVIRHSFTLDNVKLINGPAATKYDLQQEQEIQDGSRQLLRTDTRVMMSIPTDKGVAALSFAIAGDGTLSLLTDNPERKLIKSKQREVLLPLNVLEEVKGIADKTRPPEGIITKLSSATAQDGAEDFLKIGTNGRGLGLNDGDLVKISTLSEYNGLFKSTKVDDNTFDVELSAKVKDLGYWEKIDAEEAGLFFDGMVSGYEKSSDGKLRITCEKHGLETGDEVQLVGSENYNGIWPVRKIDDRTFIVDTKWLSGEAVNIKIASRRRRGLVFDGVNDYISLPEITFKSSKGLTIEAWVWFDEFQIWSRIIDFGNGAGIDNFLLANNGDSLHLAIVISGRSFYLQADGVLEKSKWMHLAATIDEKGNAILLKDGQKIKSGKVELPPVLLRKLNFIGKSNWPSDQLFKGRLSDLRIWTAARTEKQIRDSMYLQLSGREVDLCYYWRMGGVSEQKIIDFSVNGLDGIVHGQPYVSAATLNRKLASGSDAVKFCNEELIAVSQRSSYEESFEFKVISEKTYDLKLLNDTDGKGNKLFNFTYWGKSSRSDETRKQIDIVNQDPFIDLGNGWYKASCVVTIPDQISLIRCFEISNVKGSWQALEIRKHSIKLISNTVTETVYQDTISLPVLITDQDKISDSLKKFEVTEAIENRLINERILLEKKIAVYDNQQENRKRMLELENQITTLETSARDRKTEYEWALNDPTNYWCYVQGVKGKFLRLLIRDLGDVLGGNNRSTQVNNIELYEKTEALTAGSEKHYYMFRFDRLWGEKNKYHVYIRHADHATEKLTAGYIWWDFYNVGLMEQPGDSWAFKPFLQQVVVLNSIDGGDFSIAFDRTGGSAYRLMQVVDHPVSWGTCWNCETDMSSSNEITQNRRFKLISTQEVCNNNIESARKVKEDAELTYKSKKDELDKLHNILKSTPADRQDWANRITEINKELAPLPTELAKKTTELLGILARQQNTAQTMPVLATDSHGLQTQGALLGFVQPAGSVSIVESCEGNVQLSYFDAQGRMRQTNFDVTSDAANTSFEQWIPDTQRACLNFQNSGSYILLDSPISLTENYTLESWFSWPLPRFPQNALFHSDRGSFIICVDNKRLGTYFDNDPLNIHFYECGFDMESLEIGWHHIAAVASDKNTTFYIDGNCVGDLKSFAKQKPSSELNINPQDESAKSRLKLIENTDFQLRESLKYIGGFKNDWGGQPFGKISEVNVWNVALNSDEILINSKTVSSGNEPGLVAYFPLKEGTGDRIRNYAGNIGGGAIYSGVWTICTAKFGITKTKVTRFDGVDNYIIFSEQKIDFSKGLTIELWASYESIQSWSRLICISDDNFSSNVIELLNNSDGSILFLVEYTPGKQEFVISPKILVVGTWVHLAVVLDGKGNVSLYSNGALVASGKIKLPNIANRKLFLGSSYNKKYCFNGKMSDVRIWGRARSESEILQTMSARLMGDETDLVYYCPLDNVVTEGRETKAINTKGTNGAISGTVLVHSNVSLFKSYNCLLSMEYSTVIKDPVSGRKTAMMRRCLAYPVANGVNLLSDKRIELMDLKWIGNAQFAPTLLGFVEGAPPVPSENLTESDDYNGASSVQLTMSEDMEFNWSRSDESAYGSHLDLFLGSGGKASTIFGLVVQQGFEYEYKLGAQINADYSFNSAHKTNIACHSTLSLADKLDLRGSVEKKPRFPHLGNRFIPKNVGYALVVSALSDVFITRLSRSGKMIGYRVEPVEGMPPDVNTITFLMNPAYTMNGSLDGMTGSSATSDRFYKHVPDMRAQYGSLYPASYYRLKEAYDLKQQIEAEDKRREAFFMNYVVSSDRFDYSTGGNYSPSEMTLNREETKPETKVGETEEQKKIRSEKQGSKKAEEMERASSQAEKETKAKADEKRKLIEQKISDSDRQAHATDSFAGWQKRMEDLQIRSGKRNIVNTYVWDADGGLRAETQSFASTVQHSIGGTKVANFGIGGYGEFEGGFFSVKLNAQATISLTQSISKSEIRSKGLQLDIDLSGLEFRGITDYNDNPMIPGEKVDRYRFMSFFLEGSTKNFRDFFEYVVDPEWLRSNDEEARSLRQTQAGKPNKAWRVLHRVTYVERPALMGFGRDVRSLRIAPETSENKILLDRICQLEAGNKDLLQKVEKILEALKSKTVT